MKNSASGVTLKNFDDVWGLLGNPVVVEATLAELLPMAKTASDQSIYPQILSQIALAQGMQKKSQEAHATLDRAKAALTQKHCEIAEVRILLNRGKVFQQSEDVSNARDYFEQSYNLATKHGLDSYAIDAAHMIAIISEDNAEKIQWNEFAIRLANRTDNQQAQRWLGSLYSNLGHNFLDAGRYEDALDAFTRTLKYREEEGLIVNIRVANWTIACALRRLGRLDDALRSR
jgi:tetratricopeptide (TPR) repeat protein